MAKDHAEYFTAGRTRTQIKEASKGLSTTYSLWRTRHSYCRRMSTEAEVTVAGPLKRKNLDDDDDEDEDDDYDDGDGVCCKYRHTSIGVRGQLLGVCSLFMMGFRH